MGCVGFEMDFRRYTAGLYSHISAHGRFLVHSGGEATAETMHPCIHHTPTYTHYAIPPLDLHFRARQSYFGFTASVRVVYRGRDRFLWEVLQERLHNSFELYLVDDLTQFVLGLPRRSALPIVCCQFCHRRLTSSVFSRRF